MIVQRFLIVLSILLILEALTPVQSATGAVLQIQPVRGCVKIDPRECLRIVVVPTPPILPTGGGEYESVVVWLTEDGRLPTIALTDITISLTSSNLTVGSVEKSVVIRKGSIFAVGKFKTTSVSGSTVVTASSPGSLTGSVAVRTLRQSTLPGKLTIYASPPIVSATAQELNVLVVELLGLDGAPSTSSTDVTVIMSSNSTLIATPPQSVTVPAGTLFVRVKLLRTGGEAGAINITAQANNFLTSHTVFRVSNLRSNATIEANPKTLRIGERTRLTVKTFTGSEPIQDAGVIWKIIGGSIVNSAKVTDSNGTAIADIIPEAGGDITVNAYVTRSGYEPKNVSLTIRVILQQLRVQLLAPKTMNASETAGIRAIVTSEGKPVSDAKVEWGADIGAFEPSSSTTDKAGTAIANYTPDKNGTSTITASVSKEGAIPAKQSAQIIITPKGPIAAKTTTEGSPLGFDFTFIIPVPIAAILVVFLIRRRRRRKKGEEVSEGEEKEEFV